MLFAGSVCSRTWKSRFNSVFHLHLLLCVKYILTLAVYIHSEYGDKFFLTEKQLQEAKLRIVTSTVLKRDLRRAKFKNLSHQREERSLYSFKNSGKLRTVQKMCSSQYLMMLARWCWSNEHGWRRFFYLTL